MQIIDSGDGPSIERDYDVGFTQACASRRAILGGGQNYYPSFLGKIIEANQPPMKRHGLGLNSDVAAANFAMLQQASGDKFRGIDADCEAQALSAHNGRSVHSDYASVRTDQWSTGIARVHRGIGPNDVVDHASCIRAQRPPQRTDSPSSDGVLKAVGIADSDRQLTDAQLLGIAQ